MLFPIIKVKDRFGGHEHIVGQNIHDCLYVEGNAIHYLQIQGMVGTQHKDACYDFVAEDKGEYGFSGFPEIEFVTLEQMLEIMQEHLDEGVKAKIDFYYASRKRWDEKLEKAKKETGIKRDSGGELF